MNYLKRLPDAELCRLYQQGRNDAAEELLRRHSAIPKAVARYLNWRDPDLLQVGNIGMAKGALSYTPAKGSSVRTWLGENALSEMRHYIRDFGRPIRLPARIQGNPELREKHSLAMLPLEDFDSEVCQDFSGAVVESMLSELPIKQQAVMRGISTGLSVYEVARGMGISNNYAFWLRNKAREKLKRFYTTRLDLLISKPAII